LQLAASQPNLITWEKTMPRYTPQDELDRYKKRQKFMPYVIGGAAIVLVVVGIVILIISLSGGAAPKPTATLAPSATVANTTAAPTATVPLPTATVTPTVTNTPTVTPSATPIGPFEYTVQDKDTCWDLAIKFKVDLATLLALNNFPAGTCPIQPGAKIMIPAPGQVMASPTPIDISKMLPNTIVEYTIRLGDSLRAIALAFNSTQDAILKLNPTTITDANLLVAGVKIKIPVNIATPVPTLAPSSTAATKPAATSTPVPATATKAP
jgi:LysM repeat protein